MIESILLFFLLACPHPEIEYVPTQFQTKLAEWCRILDVLGPGESLREFTRMADVVEWLSDCAGAPLLSHIRFQDWPESESVWSARSQVVRERDWCRARAEILNPNSYYGEPYAQRAMALDRLADALWDIQMARDDTHPQRVRRKSLRNVREVFGEEAMVTGRFPGTLPRWSLFPD